MRKSGRKTNYSPVKQMKQATLDEFPPMNIQTDYGGSGQRAQATASKMRIEQPVEEDDVAEEVYLCNCCCFSKELSPTMKYMSTFKRLFFLFNFLVFAFGLATLGMGLWFRIDPKIYEIHKYIETQNFTNAGWIMLFGGFASCLMSMLGFAAAGRQIAGLLVLYFFVMIALTIAFVGTLVLLTVYGLGDPLEKFMIREIIDQMRRRTSTELDLDTTARAAGFIDFIQVKMRCCGAASFRDYGELGMVIPTTCYSINKNYINAPGCGPAIRQLLDLRAGLATGFTSASILVQLLTIVLSTLMFCAIYHWRANPRQVSTPLPRLSREPTPVTQPPRRGSPAYLYQQRPRSRTPIII